MDPSPDWLDVSRWKIKLLDVSGDWWDENAIDDLIREIWRDGYDQGYEEACFDEMVNQ